MRTNGPSQPLLLTILLGAGVLLAGCSQESSPRDTGLQRAKPAAPSATKAETAVQEQAMSTNMPENKKVEKVVLTDAEWRSRLSPEEYRILRQKGTERAFTGKYWNTTEPGVYRCAGCKAVLFRSDDKFDSGCGWPSFDKVKQQGAIEEHIDTSHGMIRTEVTCARCGGHLGHVFNDGPTDTGLRYCINSASIDHDDDEVKDAAKKEGPGANPGSSGEKKP